MKSTQPLTSAAYQPALRPFKWARTTAFTGLLALLAIGATPAADAAQLTWDTDPTAGIQAGSSNWNTTAVLASTNWTADGGATRVAWSQTSPTVGLNGAIFAGADGAVDSYVVTLGGPMAATNLVFNNTGYKITGSTLTSGAITVLAGKTATINSALSTTATHAIAGTLNLGGGGTFSGATTWNGAGTLNITGGTFTSPGIGGFNNAITSQTGGSVVNSSGSVAIQIGNNPGRNVNYTISGTGIIIATNANANGLTIGRSSGTFLSTLTVQSGGTVNVGTTTLGNLFLGGGGVNGKLDVQGGDVTVGTGNAANVMILFNNNGLASCTAALTQSGGNVTANGISFGTASGTYDATSLAKIQLSGGNLYIGALGLAKGIGAATLPYLIQLQGGTLGASADWTSSLDMKLGTTGGGPTIQAADSGAVAHNITLSGILSDDTAVNGTLTKTGTGTLTLSGANTYTGLTTVSAGELKCSTAGSATTAITVAPGTTSGVVLASTGGQWVNTSGVTHNNGSTTHIDFGSSAPSLTVAPMKVASLALGTGLTMQIDGQWGGFTIGQSYPLVTWTGSGPANASAFSSVVLPGGVSGTLGVSGKTLFLTVTGNTGGAVYLSPSQVSGDGTYTNATYGGRAVWGPANYLYFNVPGSFAFTPGQPVYVRIEYADIGRGRLVAQYDSTNGSAYQNAELHTRSSRVGTGGFVYSYQYFQSPRFLGGQNGGNDFRLQVSGSDGTPFYVASVQISPTPYDDPQLLYAISQPWLSPYTGPSKDFVDNQTLVGKVLAGYQGWFATPNDQDDMGWRHWAGAATVDPATNTITVDMWPWLGEYNADQVYPAGNMVQQDGRPAYLFSSRDPETVQRHFHWMRKHNIDGAYVQRFISTGNSGYYGASEFVLSNVRAAANQEGRVWAIEYDISSLSTNNALAVMTNDWQFLVNQCHILDDPRYLHENGKPVLFIWGFSVTGRNFTVAQADQIVSWFTNQNLYLIGGVNSTWQANTSWFGHYQKYDELLGWMETSQTDLVSEKNQLNGWGLKILPHAWPGFSWNNLQKTVFPTSYTARSGGSFYWTRLYNAVSCGADQLFLGMFDEYDEGTAIMPMSDNHPDIYNAGGTNTWGHYLDNEGLDPFWYLRLSGAGREMLNGQRTVSSSLPAASALSPVAYAGTDATVYLGPTNMANGLTQIQQVDGPTSSSFLGNHDCIINGGLYVYFRIDDTFCVSNFAGQACTVEIEYYDNTPGAVLRLHYDSLTAAYTTHPTSVTTTGTGGWKNFRWTLTNGYFGNRENGGSDFRINITPAGKTVGLRRASVFLPEEQSGSVAAGAPALSYSNGWLTWPATADATGYQLYQTASLASPNWQPVSVPLSVTNGVFQYQLAATNSAGFYRLGRPGRN